MAESTSLAQVAVNKVEESSSEIKMCSERATLAASQSRMKTVDAHVSFAKLDAIKPNTNEAEVISLAWDAIQEAVSLKLMGGRGCAVPHLHDAGKYGLLNLVIKEQKSITDKIIGHPANMHWSSQLEQLLPSHVKIENFRTTFNVDLIDDDCKEEMCFHFVNKKKSKAKERCEIWFSLRHVQHYRARPNKPDTPIDLKKQYKNPDKIQKIYLITEVYVAKNASLCVKIGDKKHCYKRNWLTPVGIVFNKCQLSERNTLLTYGPEVDHKKACSYNWVPSDESVNQEVKDLIHPIKMTPIPEKLL